MLDKREIRKVTLPPREKVTPFQLTKLLEVFPTTESQKEDLGFLLPKGTPRYISAFPK